MVYQAVQSCIHVIQPALANWYHLLYMIHLLLLIITQDGYNYPMKKKYPGPRHPMFKKGNNCRLSRNGVRTSASHYASNCNFGSSCHSPAMLANDPGMDVVVTTLQHQVADNQLKLKPTSHQQLLPLLFDKNL